VAVAERGRSSHTLFLPPTPLYKCGRQISQHKVMGHRFLDQYSLLHAATGVMAYFWSIPFWIAFILHMLFEWIENSAPGVRFIQWMTDQQRLYPFPWPGGKHEADSLLNQWGDNLTFALGWLSAAGLDRYGTAQGWYFPNAV
jgi:hypothetical protein